jgi:single-strand DNA-binding protein
VEIIAESVQFLGSRDDSGGGGNGFTPRSDVPVDTADFQPTGVRSGGDAPSDDDIPF